MHDATIISHVKHFGQIRSSSRAIKGFPKLGRHVSSPNEAPGANLPAVRHETTAKQPCVGLAAVIRAHGCAEVCVDGIAGAGRACVGVLACMCNMVLRIALCLTTHSEHALY